ncbi:hypothetical protein LCGC14_1214300 [marine sediment metagenome]|uniref:Uncharacterized protein n=1 Tax=marine sediment metagenome TaxID=412755 RepID=A0A0F9LHB9_9ZZZZ
MSIDDPELSLLGVAILVAAPLLGWVVGLILLTKALGL